MAYGRRAGLAAWALQVLCWLLFPLGWLMAKLHRLAYRCLLKRHRAPVPVVSVGNLSVGGTGKSTFACWLGKYLLQRGHKPALLLRGYKGRASGEVVEATSSPEVVGDEALMLKQRLPEAVVIAGRNRLESAHKAAELGCDVVILDDGFQYLKLHHDLELVLVQPGQLLQAGRLLPAGVLRDPLDLLALADCCIVTGAQSADELEALETLLAEKAPHLPWAWAEYAVGHVRDAALQVEPATTLQGKRVVAFCGVGNPDSFQRTLERAGAEVLELVAFADHHAFTQGDIDRIESLRARAGAELIVCTEKDAVKLQRLHPPETLRVVRGELKVTFGARLLVERLHSTVEEGFRL